MALVIVATPGASTANSYLTLAEAEAFVLEMLNVDAWTGATTANKNAALVQATHDIDSLPLFGEPDGQRYNESASDYQPLHFPITETFDDTDTAYIPDDVKRATTAQAVYLLRAGMSRQATEDVLNSGIKRQALGHFDQDYQLLGNSRVCSLARSYLKRWATQTRKLDFA